MKVTPQQEHRWLERLVGDWTYEAKYEAPPGEPEGKDGGTERVRPLGGFWVICEGQGQAPEGEAASSIMTLGYDPARATFVGTFVSSMMTHLWIYDRGTLDAAGRALTLEAEGPGFTAEGELAEGKTAKYRDVMTFESDDHRVFTSQTLRDDGTWHQFMETHYRRTK
jgi:hypothetical protein